MELSRMATAKEDVEHVISFMVARFDHSIELVNLGSYLWVVWGQITAKLAEDVDCLLRVSVCDQPSSTVSNLSRLVERNITYRGDSGRNGSTVLTSTSGMIIHARGNRHRNA